MEAINEIEIRQKLQALLENTHKNDDAVFIHELLIDNAQRRADLVMANGKLSGFEIKSELDNLDRLSGQLETYVRIFEEVFVVSASKHIRLIRKMLPVGVGLIEFDGSKFSQIIPASTNKKLNVIDWVSHLTVLDLKLLLKSHSKNTSGRRSELIIKVQAIPVDEVREFTLQVLKHKFPYLLKNRTLRKIEVAPHIVEKPALKASNKNKERPIKDHPILNLHRLRLETRDINQ